MHHMLANNGKSVYSFYSYFLKDGGPLILSCLLLFSVNVSIICVIKCLVMCKYCALLSYNQFVIIIGLKADSLFK